MLTKGCDPQSKQSKLIGPPEEAKARRNAKSHNEPVNSSYTSRAVFSSEPVGELVLVVEVIQASSLQDISLFDPNIVGVTVGGAQEPYVVVSTLPSEALSACTLPCTGHGARLQPMWKPRLDYRLLLPLAEAPDCSDTHALLVQVWTAALPLSRLIGE